MRVEDCFLLGRILKPHSLHGECKVYFDVDFIEDYEDLESVYVLQGNKLTPFLWNPFVPRDLTWLWSSSNTSTTATKPKPLPTSNSTCQPTNCRN
ncbi:MAG: hypothetical protein IPN95_04500 [Bacteroidetes bacterium]|nr:hypothetical protein [Bacteroidota bacterium]